MGIFDKWKRNKQKNPAVDVMRGSNELTLEQVSPVTKSIVVQLGYPYQIFSTEASYEEVMEAYGQAILQGKREGFTPVLVRSDDVLDEYLGILKDEEYTGDEADEFDMEEFMGVFDGVPEMVDRYTAFREYQSNRIVETILLKVPTTKPWELVAYVPFGGWNECPAAEQMMAVCKY